MTQIAKVHPFIDITKLPELDKVRPERRSAVVSQIMLRTAFSAWGASAIALAAVLMGIVFVFQSQLNTWITIGLYGVAGAVAGHTFTIGCARIAEEIVNKELGS
jgi:energy-converting hydrogenase Eha subunit A